MRRGMTLRVLGYTGILKEVLDIVNEHFVYHIDEDGRLPK